MKKGWVIQQKGQVTSGISILRAPIRARKWFLKHFLFHQKKMWGGEGSFKSIPQVVFFSFPYKIFWGRGKFNREWPQVQCHHLRKMPMIGEEDFRKMPMIGEGERPSCGVGKKFWCRKHLSRFCFHSAVVWHRDTACCPSYCAQRGKRISTTNMKVHISRQHRHTK